MRDRLNRDADRLARRDAGHPLADYIVWYCRLAAWALATYLLWGWILRRLA